MDEAALRRLAEAAGFTLVPRRKLKEPWAQLAHALRHFAIDAVLDVGANRGQYGTLLREQGWPGPILSFEPLPEAHAELVARAAADRAWTVAPRQALGAEDGAACLEVSAESDMSSLLPQGPLLRRISPSSAVRAQITVPVRRLDGAAEIRDAPWRRMLLKIDVQGAESSVLEGASGLWPRLAGLQVELPLVPLYEGERPWRATLDTLEARGFAPHLWIPGYFSRELARHLQIDVVLFRASAPAAGP
jgi:FkbM family methyltransferase